MTGSFPPLTELLAAQGLSGVDEQPLEHDGYSGALLTRLVRGDGARFVLKRMSLDRDWVMRSTEDTSSRETCVAAAGLDLGTAVATPSVGVACDRAANASDEYAVLMRDISDALLPPGMISHAQVERIIEAMAALHRAPVPRAAIPWCALDRRMLLLTPAGGQVAAAYGAPVARDIGEGWQLFETLATPGARAIIGGLANDVSPLLQALGALRPAFLHGDLKLDNIGIGDGGVVWLIDWAMTLVAPPAGELGWFLAINSRRMPVSLDEAMALYADAAGMPAAERPTHDALTAVCGLLLRGWRKALDAAAGEPEELAWWCERVEAARPFLEGGRRG